MGVAVPTSARLRNQRLVGSTLERPEDVVAWMGAVQAQEFGPARWGVGQRMSASTDAAVEQAFNDGRILRTHILRPTWHFVHPRDIRWMLAVSGPRVHVANGFSYRRDGLTPKILARGVTVIARALEGGRHLTRAELASALKAARLPHGGQALAYVVMYAELEAMICSGPRRGKQFTYALLDERVPATPALSNDEGLAELTRRYFTSHGPATMRDFTWWSGLTVAQARTGLAASGSAIEQVDIDGQTCWRAVEAEPLVLRSPLVRLLPIYDEFLVAFRDRGWAASTRAKGPVAMAPNTFAHQLVIDGRVEGSWTQVRGPREVEVRVVAWAPLPDRLRRVLDAEIRRYSAFLESPVRLILAV
jgi:hypothetical protein